MKPQSYRIWVVVTICLYLIVATDTVQAQVTSDGTLTTPTLVKKGRNPDNGRVFRIRGGTQTDGNLFHSFEQFSVPKGGRVIFKNEPGVNNIFSRVTGAEESRINGIIETNGTANFFLLNPNGIIFGPHAQLSINGSFIASTARSVVFEDGTRFRATVAQATPLLTMKSPVGLQFGDVAKPIRIREAQLRGAENRTLALVGGDVSIKGGNLILNDQANLQVPGGRIEIGSVAPKNTVRLTPDSQGWVLGYEEVQDFQDITIVEGADLDANFLRNPNNVPEDILDRLDNRRGNVQLQGRRITLTEGSQISLNNYSSSPGFSAGTIDVTASEFVKLSGISDVDKETNTNINTATVSRGTAGDLTIKTGQLILEDGAAILSSSSPIPRNENFTGGGDGGNLTIKASESVEIVGGPNGDSNLTVTAFPGDAGNIKIITPRLSLSEGGKISANSISGTGGNITLEIGDILQLRYESNISATAGTEESGGGNGGNITINAQFIVAVPNENSDISANAFTGSGGRVEITATGIFGIEFREEQNDDFSDITASSTFGQSGVVEINRPEVDPQTGVVELPQETINAEQLIVEGCQSGGKLASGEFVITGRGGLPIDPTETVDVPTVLPDLGSPGNPSTDQNPASFLDKQQQVAPANELKEAPWQPIVEAQGWLRDANGKIVLTAQAPTVTPHTVGTTPATCSGSLAHSHSSGSAAIAP